jgi:hypothetical protein
LPDTVPESLTGQATGQVWQTAQTRGHAEDRRRDAVRTGRGQLATRERGQAVRGPGAIVTAPHQHGAIVSAETLDRPHLASSPASWHPMCIPCAARTPLVLKSVHAFIWPFSRAARRPCSGRALYAPQTPVNHIHGARSSGCPIRLTRVAAGPVKTGGRPRRSAVRSPLR